MALAPGYFPANYFPHDYWQIGSQYFTEHGAAVAPTITITVGGSTVDRRRRRRRRVNPRLLELFKTYLEMKQN